jgi:anthranilate/para-aminobenzoate synthase component I
MKKAAPVVAFSAGTLSGAPKHRAMQLIEEYEKQIVIFWRCHRFHGL